MRIHHHRRSADYRDPFSRSSRAGGISTMTTTTTMDLGVCFRETLDTTPFLLSLLFTSQREMYTNELVMNLSASLSLSPSMDSR